MAKQVLDTGVGTRLLAVVTQTLRRGTDLGVVANIATLVAGATRERRHVDYCTGKLFRLSDTVARIVYP
jgi:hypothetical protein